MPTKIEKDAVSGQDTTGHEWDGLRELNTPTPRWWLNVFYVCIAFALIYMVFYPALPIPGATGLLGWTARGAFPAELERATAARAPMLARLRGATPEAIVADPELRGFALAGGRAAFAANCASCHGAGGQGAAGGYPSLADDDWLWGGSLTAIRATIAHGVRNGEDDDARNVPMPGFLVGGQLTRPQVGDVAEYVMSLTNRATDGAAATRGSELFAENCVSCHGERGAGNREFGAPRLDDAIWLYGSDRAAVLRSISGGRGGVMPAWEPRLDPAVINMLTVYVHSLGGGEAE